MSLKVNRLKAYLRKTFSESIDLSDLTKRSQEEIDKNFESRALTAYALMALTGCTIEEASTSITDGFDDNGIDAIYFDKTSKRLWLVQTKFIHNGTGGIDNGDIEKFTKGVKLLIDGDFTRFNAKVKNKEVDLLQALDDASVKVQLLLAYTGKSLSTHNLLSLQDLMDDLNDPDEIVILHDFNLDKAYRVLEHGIGDVAITEDVILNNWGHIEEPIKSYYGQVSGTDLGTLYQKYGVRLFTENIRSFLGNSGANDEIIQTIKTEPENFVYFNNGITVLCEKIKKKVIGGADKSVGIFECNGMAVVNGAQTLGTIGSMYDANPDELEKIRVIVKFISLEDAAQGFGKRITIATNTQNKVDKKDFISLDPEQARLKIELKMENIDYHFKRSEDKILPDETNYILDEVAFGMASFNPNVDYSTMVKKESGKLWQDVTTAPYTDLFNSGTTAAKVIKVVSIYRAISQTLKDLAAKTSGKERSINLYGNSLVAHIVYQKCPKDIWPDESKSFADFKSKKLQSLIDTTIAELHQKIGTEYPDSMIVYVLRNYTKCRHLKSILV
ncbi:hypothetical protein ASU31_10640 [Pedobacter ginsenosidimutans]|uniref:Abortive phage infection protein C-terminal domain-containing protein n=1 Tax=Pedobacter ginsenosidimutans TaxID=687842 RepID=A0A0T5VRV9_9SPHI|nr:AIPR family protein [Pedobacter ginsenosidimutans]KRT15957.1 hypothetical protein ASU31_10640 [Pedobacter ginsenosidimutans]